MMHAPDAVIFLRDVRRILQWRAPSRYIALPLMRMRSNNRSPTFAERYAMLWLLLPDLIAGWLLRGVWPTCRIDGWGCR